jgi:hypothetical protein
MESIQRCHITRLKCETLLKTPSPQHRPVSSDKNDLQLRKKNGVRGLGYNEPAGKMELRTASSA